MPQESRANIVTTTITGVVASGYDTSGVFGFAPGTDLTGQPFKLVYTFDDTKGTSSVTDCSPGVPCSSSINSTAVSNPGTAVLTIGTGSYTFGTMAGATSSVMRVISPLPNQIQYSVKDPVGLDDTIATFVYPAIGTVLTTDYNWEDALWDNDLENLQAPFTINTDTQFATGWLIPQTIVVEGAAPPPPPQPAPQPEGDGDCERCNEARHPGQVVAGNPITISTGNKFEKVTDYRSSGQNPLSFSRYYNSLAPAATLVPKMFGTYWTCTYDRYIVASGTRAAVGRTGRA